MKHFDDGVVLLAVEFYRDGGSLSDAADLAVANERTVRKWLCAAGVTVRGRGNPLLGRVDVDVDEIVRLVREKLNHSEIARKLGVGPGVVYRRLNALGVFD